MDDVTTDERELNTARTNVTMKEATTSKSARPRLSMSPSIANTAPKPRTMGCSAPPGCWKVRPFSPRKFFTQAKKSGIYNGKEVETAYWKALRSIAAGRDKNDSNLAKAMLGRKSTKKQVKAARRMFQASISVNNGSMVINSGSMGNVNNSVKRAASPTPSVPNKKLHLDDETASETEEKENEALSKSAIDFDVRLQELVKIIELTPTGDRSGEGRLTTSFRPTRQKLVFEVLAMVLVPALRAYAVANAAKFSEKLIKAACRKTPAVRYPPSFKYGWDLARFALLFGSNAGCHSNDAEIVAASLRQFRKKRNAISHYDYEPVRNMLDEDIRLMIIQTGKMLDMCGSSQEHYATVSGAISKVMDRRVTLWSKLKAMITGTLHVASHPENAHLNRYPS